MIAAVVPPARIRSSLQLKTASLSPRADTPPSRAVFRDTSSIAVTRTSKQRSVRAWPAVSPGFCGAGPIRARERA